MAIRGDRRRLFEEQGAVRDGKLGQTARLADGPLEGHARGRARESTRGVGIDSAIGNDSDTR